jgi:predicted RNA-binding protein YlxR (DUF448 family)/ribosomal protein L30E
MAEAQERLCIVTGERLPMNALIRFVLSPEGEVVPDLKHELPGRGVWVKANAQAVAKAVADCRFPKAFRAGCRADSALPQRIAGLIRADARQYLALANKAGLVAVGFERTAAALDSGKSRVLVEAADGSEEGHRKLRSRRPSGCEIVAEFDARELSLALGRANVIHAALAEGSLTGKFLAAARLAEAFCHGPQSTDR